MLKSIPLSIVFSFLLSSAAFAAGYVNDDPPDYNRVPGNEGNGSTAPLNVPDEGPIGGDRDHDVVEKTPWSLITPALEGRNETDRTKQPQGRRNMQGAPNSSEGQPVLKQARSGQLMQAGLGLLSAPGYNLNNLPPTVFKGFVSQAGGNAFLIYGDEGIYLPPFFGFEKPHRIAQGNLPGMLGTGHGSLLQDAWGKDEFIGNEQSVSGPTYDHPDDGGF